MFIKIATIEKQENGKYKLTIYKEGKAIIVKDYDSFKNAKIAQAKLLKIHRLS